MRSEILMDLQKRYKNYNIDDKIEEIIDKLVEDELNLKKIDLCLTYLIKKST